ncbi:YslB family protein [Ligilactobacillus pobuzihii]|uniref:DUF2507 domain-containing protein n=1 Tax=Ligilactobacillus pobuzihii TaxID=449659 RepID=A0A0R2LC30_9LACO|nr:YslB family protein [Ligilactobacillus pobuzihii]KRK10022.1 hypothetical protein FD11_GL000266 [Ligilactobacillus pobuzihii E100301 = KCTC 13174]KRN96247.1 hypothetical protein IV66_GL000741 [Ligilactobacillus pobuzihii]GEN48443.1 hypothetical protein LPO01_12350 [Ligilactobacillus pobuzihii]
MSKKFFDISASTQNFSTTLLRDDLIPALTGKDGNILYWAGKKLARDFVLNKDEELSVFFDKAGWGELKRVKSQKSTQTFELSGPVIQTRLQLSNNANFLLEAGFLAETIQNQLGNLTEAIVTSTKKDIVTILVKIDWDSHGKHEELEQDNIINLLENEDQ